MRNKKIELMVKTALFMALTAIVTLFVSIPTGTGNVNMGDTVILIASLFLPGLPLAFAGGVGSMIADLIAYPPFAFFTLIIKSCEGLIVYYLFKYFKTKFKRNNVSFFLASLIAVVIIPVGYFFANWIMGGIGAGVGDIPQELVQASISLAVANVLYYPLSTLAKEN